MASSDQSYQELMGSATNVDHHPSDNIIHPAPGPMGKLGSSPYPFPDEEVSSLMKREYPAGLHAPKPYDKE